MAINLSLGKDVKLEEAFETKGSSTLKSGVYTAQVKNIYFTETNSGTGCANIVLSINGNVKTFPVYVTWKETKSPVRTKDGKPQVMPGYRTLNSLAYLLTGKGVNDLEQEEKTIMVYSFKDRKEQPTKASCITELMNKTIQVGIIEIKKHKSMLSNGVYVPTTDTFNTNEISQFFDEDGYTASEKAKGIDPSYLNAWKTRFEGKLQEEKLNTVPVDPATLNKPSSVGAPGVSVDDLFNTDNEDSLF